MTPPPYTVKDYSARQSIGYLIRRARNLVTAKLEARFADSEITFAQWAVLMCLRDDIARTSSEICQHLYCDTGAFTRLVDQLEERALLTRSRSTEDRRVVELALTEKGLEMVESLVGIAVDFYNESLAEFDREETETLTHLLTKFIAGLTPCKDAAKDGGK